MSPTAPKPRPKLPLLLKELAQPGHLAAWEAILPVVEQVPEYDARLDSVMALPLLVNAYVSYRAAHAEAQRATGEKARILHGIAEQHRSFVRSMAADFFLLPQERVDLAPLNEDGLDAKLLSFFSPGGRPLMPRSSARGRAA